MSETKKTPHYLTQFPDYDNGEAFEALAAELAPFGFKDWSWKNDENPCIGIELDMERTLSIYVEYKDEETRDYAESCITYHDYTDGTDTYLDLNTFDPKEIRAAFIKHLAGIKPTLPEISTENTLDQLGDALNRFAAGTALKPLSADEMLCEIPEDHPHRQAAFTWLTAFCEIWRDVEEAMTPEEQAYQAWRKTAEKHAPTEEDLEIYPDANLIIEHSDGGRIGIVYGIPGTTYQVNACTFGDTFDDVETARRALWREWSSTETGAMT